VDNRVHAARVGKACTRVERDRNLAALNADRGYHLGEAERVGAGDQFGEQRAADALALHSDSIIDRVFDREAIGGAGVVGGEIGAVAHRAVLFGGDVGQADSAHLVHPRSHLGCGRREFLRCGSTVQHVRRVDGGDGVSVGGGAVAQPHRRQVRA